MASEDAADEVLPQHLSVHRTPKQQQQNPPSTNGSTLHRSPHARRGVSHDAVHLGSALSDSTIGEALRRTQGDKTRVRSSSKRSAHAFRMQACNFRLICWPRGLL